MVDQLEISETNEKRNQIIVNRKYKFNLWYTTNNTKVFKCTEYKTVNKCKSYITLNDNNKVIKYENKHTHPGKEYDASVSIVKHKMKNEIRKSSFPFDIKPKRIYEEISQEIGYICPEYNTIKSQILRYKNKQLPPDISTFNEIPDESEYYINERNENFMIFKNSNIIIFQSPFQTELFIEYNENMFVDGTFYIAPTFGYQVFITRVYAPEINSFYSTSLSILNNKEQSTYELLFEELKKNASKYNNNIIITPKILHCDFEKGISNAAIKIFPNITIKYCVWHYKRSLKIQKYKLCHNEVEHNHNIYLFYKAVTNFPFINPEYIFDIYNYIKIICQVYNYYHFLNFLEYFNKTYLYKYDIQCWNYCNDINHITNNASVSFNNYLKKLFYKKPSFYELIYHLKKEESLSYNNYKRKIGGIWKKKEEY
ncbi:hypothetical protein BCR32DRAFT_303757 [Anaeromyces robustus]|uniref:FLYWCH-type domain-containing protein n=1 Tax=Anaeromyces robustus TaxID=1754192 RepID=A0A1Y1WT54_9FUNG|nr:hypothetical protein BCR32DRAFT_303757 [Anaeromyces robustus]|eukprot:ORX76575.1 hypothetical protein BCR32DRAFT_303757 [Anaeromyces robustus]